MKREAPDADAASAGRLYQDSVKQLQQQRQSGWAGDSPQSLALDNTSPPSQLAQSQRYQPGGLEDGVCQSPNGSMPPVTPPSGAESVLIPSAQRLGPMSARPVLPARKKPGRRPIPEQEVGDRRRKQNRESQRNFRQRKQDKFSEALNDKMTLQRRLKEKELELQGALESQKRQFQEAMEAQKQQIQEAMEAEKRQILEAMEAKRHHYELGHVELRRRAEDAEQRAANLDAKLARISRSSSSSNDQTVQISSLGPRARTTGSSGGVADITPTEEYEETDFTATWRRKTVAIDNTRPNYVLDEQTAGFDNCGFCTDAGNCQCRSVNNEPEIEAQPSAGNCNSCLQNPSRQACCRQIANTARNVPENTLAPIMMPCSRFFDKAEARTQKLTSISKLFGPGNSLQAYTSGSAGFQVSEQEAAQALQTLSTSSPK